MDQRLVLLYFEGSLVQFLGNKHMQLFFEVLYKILRYLIDEEYISFNIYGSNIRI